MSRLLLDRYFWSLSPVVIRGSKCNSAEDFTSASASNGLEVTQAIVSCRQGCVAYAIGDFNQFVGVCSGVAIGANRRCDGENGDRSVIVVPACYVAASARGGIDRAWIPRDAVRHADIQSILQNVLAHPGAVNEPPFLQTGSGLGLGVGYVPIDWG